MTAAAQRDRAERKIPDVGRYFEFVGDPRNRAQAGLFAWIGDYLTPSNFFQAPFTCPQPVTPPGSNFNVSQFCDPAVDAAFERAVAASGLEANDLWTALDRMVVSAAPAVPLVNRREVVFVSDRVGNVQQHSHLGPLLDQFWVR